MRAWLVVILTGALLAGCVRSDDVLPAPSEDEDLGTASSDSPRREPAPVRATSDEPAAVAARLPASYYTIRVEATPEGGVASALWTIPEGAFVPAWWDETDDELALEFVPIVDEDAPVMPTDWALMVFEEGDDGMELELVMAAVTGTLAIRQLPLVGSEGQDLEPGFDPGTLTFSPEDTKEGGQLGLVLAAMAPEPVPFEIAFRILPEDPFESDHDTSDDLEEFVEAAGPGPVSVLDPRATASGFTFALYLDLNIAAPLPFGLTWTAGPILVDESTPLDLRPLGDVRTLSLASNFASEEGWSAMAGFYWTDVSVGDWSAAANAHGEAVDASGRIVMTPVASPHILVGAPYFGLVAEGPGGAAGAFALSTTHAGKLEIAVYQHLALGATLETLFGESAMTGSYTYTGLLSSEAPASRVEDAFSVSWRGGHDLHVLNPPPLAR